MTLTGTNAIDGTGNELNNTLWGNAGDNQLDGGVGFDTLIGGAGNDTYIVDSPNDLVSETDPAGGTRDTVRSSLAVKPIIFRPTAKGIVAISAL